MFHKCLMQAGQALSMILEFGNTLISEPKMMTYQNCVLIDDSGYGIEPLLMTPHTNPQNNFTRKYNARFKAERVIIGRCFGQLKRRFPFLHHPWKMALVQVPKLISCCVILHSIAKYLHDRHFPDVDEALENEE